MSIHLHGGWLMLIRNVQIIFRVIWYFVLFFIFFIC